VSSQSFPKKDIFGKEIPVRVKISAKSLRDMFHPCTLGFISKVCHAHCCETSLTEQHTLIAIAPFEQPRIESLGGVVKNGILQTPNKRCTFKNDQNLCSIHEKGQPLGCSISPFTFTKNGNTLIVRNRYRRLRCWRAKGAKPAYKAHRRSLEILFGAEKTEEIAQHLDKGGGDLVVEMDREIFARLRGNDESRFAALKVVE